MLLTQRKDGISQFENRDISGGISLNRFPTLPLRGAYCFYEDDLSGQIRANFLYRPAEFAIAAQENILLFLSRFNNQSWNILPCHHYYSSSKEPLPKDELIILSACRHIKLTREGKRRS